MSVNGSTNESLLETEYAYPGCGVNSNSDTWSEVRTKPWHTQSNAAPSGSVSSGSGFNPNAYRRSTTWAAGSAHTFTSGVPRRSNTSEVRPNRWAKIRAYQPCRPMGDTARETGSAVDAWNSDDNDDDSEDDTVI
jgi:hypothetical protein